MLRDTGIKTKIIKQYLPAINKLVNQHLQVLDFFVSFDLDESFQETIRSRYRDDFTYESFSEGEKDRIEMAGIELQNRVRDTYLKLSQRFQDRYKVIDGHDSIDNIHTKILDEIRSREYI